MTSEPETSKLREDQEPPMVMGEMKVRDVSIPQTTNVTSTIQKPTLGERFELKKNIVKLLHTNGQFTVISHEDPRVHIQNFLKMSDRYTPPGVNSNYERFTLFPFSLLGKQKDS